MDDKIIKFPGGADKPGGKPAKPDKSARKSANSSEGKLPVSRPVDPANLSEDQKKALQIVLSGMTFIAVGIKPTDSGADFFTAVHGEPTDLRNAAPHLPGVIERAYERKGM